MNGPIWPPWCYRRWATRLGLADDAGHAVRACDAVICRSAAAAAIQAESGGRARLRAAKAGFRLHVHPHQEPQPVPVSLHPYVVAARLHRKRTRLLRPDAPYSLPVTSETERIIGADASRALSPGVPTWQVPCRAATASA
ncbi:hypothetical protein XFF6990_360005 [Xanthomonas citri pv. fuscans]|nr:hypothetical protein XFF6990_360005 [Xanthomonas citri pv. fuscans]